MDPIWLNPTQKVASTSQRNYKDFESHHQNKPALDSKVWELWSHNWSLNVRQIWYDASHDLLGKEFLLSYLEVTMMDIPLESDRQVHGAFASIFFLARFGKEHRIDTEFLDMTCAWNWFKYVLISGQLDRYPISTSEWPEMWWRFYLGAGGDTLRLLRCCVCSWYTGNASSIGGQR